MTDKAAELSRSADSSDLLDKAVRVGIVSYGVVHLLIAWLAVRLAFGDSAGKASSSGALAEIAQKPLGQVTLYVVAAGFVALVVWQGIEAAAGHRDEEGKKRLVKRVTSAGKAVIYGALAFSAAKTAAEGGGGGGGSTGGGGGGTDSMTASVLGWPGGQLLVSLVGLAVIGVAGALVWRGLSEKFLKKLDAEGRSGDSGRAFVIFGKVGYVAKGVSLAVIGGLFLWAAWTSNAKKSGGLDAALRQVLEQPFGSALLVALAAGIACFGLFCFAWARHLDRS